MRKLLSVGVLLALAASVGCDKRINEVRGREAPTHTHTLLAAAK